MDSSKVLHVKLNGRQVSDALTNDYASQSIPGATVVVTDRPYILLSVVRKRWLKRLRKMRIQRAQFLAGPEANQLTSRILALETLQFIAGHTANRPKANLTFIAAKEIIQSEVTYRVMYITCTLPNLMLKSLISRMPPDGLVIIYEE